MRLPDALRSLRHRDLRLFFSGQAISLVGTWMQSVALSWLMYRLTRSSELLGLLGFLGQVPVFLLGAWAGSLADRIPRRSLVLATQTAAMVQASLLAAVTLAHEVKAWHLLALAGLLGVVNAFDIPTRQAYMTDMAGEDLENAIAFNSTVVNSARVVGPALAGYVVALVGEGMCFLLNAVSYVAVIGALAMTHTTSPPWQGRGRGHLAEGFQYAFRTPHVRALLLLVAAAALTAMPYTVLMPVFAKDVLGGGPELLGRLFGAAGLGALLGAFAMLRLKGIRGLGRRVAWGSTLFALGLVGLAGTNLRLVAEGSLVLAGFGFMTLMASTNTLLQSLTPPSFRGRVTGLYSMMFVGMTPFGALAIGELAHLIGPRAAVLIGAVLLLTASLAFHRILPALRKRVIADHPLLFPQGPT